MSRQRVSAVIGAIVLAMLGIIGMVAYVSGAEERAASGETLAEVFVVDRRVPAGTSADRIDDFVTLDTVPQKLVTSGTVGVLTDLDGLVAEVELLPGELLSLARFVEPQVFERALDRVVEVPVGLQEITLALTAERAGGGLVLPGDTVGVLMSFDPFQTSSEVPVEIDGGLVSPGGSTSTTTKQTLHKLLVTNVQLEEVPEVVEREGIADEETREIRLVPSGNLLITLAVDVADAEKLIFGSEHGTLWLTNEPDTTIESPSIIQNRGTIYEEVEAEDGATVAAISQGDE